MDEFDKQKILERYADRISAYGHGAAALGEPKQRQAFYFDALAQVEGLLPDDSVVDVGCGYGDLASYLRTLGWRGQYVGLDINPQLIEEGRRRYPGADLRALDIQQDTLDQQFDWCICCHALTSNTESMPFLEHLQIMLDVMWASCRKGLVFNLLSPLADYTHPVHARPAFAEVLAVLNQLTNRFTLRHDYMPFEYAIYAYKDNAVRRDLLIFQAQTPAFETASGRWQTPVDSAAPGV